MSGSTPGTALSGGRGDFTSQCSSFYEHWDGKVAANVAISIIIKKRFILVPLCFLGPPALVSIHALASNGARPQDGMVPCRSEHRNRAGKWVFLLVRNPCHNRVRRGRESFCARMVQGPPNGRPRDRLDCRKRERFNPRHCTFWGRGDFTSQCSSFYEPDLLHQWP